MTDADVPSTPLVSADCRAAFRTGLKHFVRHLVGLLLIFATLLLSYYLTVDRVGSSLKHVVEQKINDRLAGTGLSFALESLNFVEGEGIRLRGVRIDWDPALAVNGKRVVSVPTTWEQLAALKSSAFATSSDSGQSGESALSRTPASYRPVIPGDQAKHSITVSHVLLRGEWSMADLARGRFVPDAVELDGLSISLELQANQTISMPMLPEGEASPVWPKVVQVSRGDLQILRFDGTVFQEIRDFSIRVEPGGGTTDGLTAAGQLRWLTHQPLRFRWQSAAGEFGLSADWRSVYWHDEVWPKIAPLLPPSMEVLRGVNGWLDIEAISVRGHIGAMQAVEESAAADQGWGLRDLQVDGRLHDVSIKHAKLPLPILRGHAKFHADLTGASCTEISGEVSEGSFAASGELVSWSNPQIDLHVTGRELPFNRRWTGVLTERLRRAWENFQAEGIFDCDLKFGWRPGGVFTREGTVKVKNVSYVYHEFPLPVSGVSGDFEIENDDCRFDLVSLDPRCPVTIQGYANQMGPGWTGEIGVRSTHYHAYSDDLLEGLRKKPEAVDVIRQMNFSGMIACNGKIVRSHPEQKADVRFNIGIHSGEFRHRVLPYRIFGVSGMFSVINGIVTADQLVGVSSTGNIELQGQSIPGGQWWVKVIGRAVELNQELYQALSPNLQSVWNQLNPRGALDQIAVHVHNRGSGTQFTVSGHQQVSTAKDPSTLSIEPTWFPYALERLSGSFHYEAGELSIANVQGTHLTVPVSFSAHGRTSDEVWVMRISDLLTGQIPIDFEILQALPPALQQAAEQLTLRGSVAVQGDLTVSHRFAASPTIALAAHHSPTPELAELDPRSGARSTFGPGKISAASSPLPGGRPTPDLNWNLRLDVEDVAMNLGLPVQNVHGHVLVHGRRDSQQAFSHGQVLVDSAMIRGVQVTALQGPFWCSQDWVLLGTQVGQVGADLLTGPIDVPSSMSAQCLGGRVSLDGQVRLQSPLQFQIQTTVNQLDLARLASHFAPGTRDIAGQGAGSLVLAGSSAGTHTYQGAGKIEIGKARLYEIPFFLQLLKALQIKAPDKTAFDEGKIDFQILGSDVECRRIELNGDAISLIGQGRANFNQELDLNFYTVLGRNRYYLPLISDLLHAGSQQLLWISVKGTADRPLIQRETLRALNEAVRLLLEDPVD